MIPDQDLLARYRDRGSRDAFEAIVARHGAMVYRVARRVVVDRHEAEDVTQAAFLALAQRPGSVDHCLAGWLHKVARDTARKLCRSRSRRTRREQVRGLEVNATTRSDDVAELREELDAALTHLPDSLREAIILHYLEGNAYQEAAVIAGCSESAFRMRTSRGLRQLRDVLANRGVACGTAALASFMAAENATGAVIPPLPLLENLSRSSTALPQVSIKAARPVAPKPARPVVPKPTRSVAPRPSRPVAPKPTRPTASRPVRSATSRAPRARGRSLLGAKVKLPVLIVVGLVGLDIVLRLGGVVFPTAHQPTAVPAPVIAGVSHPAVLPMEAEETTTDPAPRPYVLPVAAGQSADPAANSAVFNGGPPPF